ncbi:MAG: pantetheine-phosphate adenylyltransferase [Chloroflexota bacterium]
MSITALYPGTFDPVTLGHLDVATRAARLFDRLVVGVYDAPPKNLLFNTEERVRLFREAASHLPNVEVLPYSGLTVDFARKIHAKVIIRGIRAFDDFLYEYEMALMNAKMAPEIETIILMTKLEYSYFSSTRVREIAPLGGDISDLVPPNVLAAVKAKLAERSRR